MQNGTTSSSTSSPSTAASASTAPNQTIAAAATAKQQLPHHHLHNDFISDSFLPASQLPYSSSLAGAYLDFRSLMQQHQDLVNRHALCLTRLRQFAREVESLRDENSTLRSVNRELNSHLSFVIRNQCLSSSSTMSLSSGGGLLRGYDCSPAASSFDMLSGFRDLCNIGMGGGGRDDVAGAENESPTSVMEARSIENLESDRVSLPKSISVRSNGYSKTRLPTTVSAPAAAVPAPCKTRGLTRSRTAIPLTTGSHKVYVRGAMQEQEPLELEVYHQGTSKTELCNKWQETGACPYGEHCQFAHGIKELRPVIRHPRYKTEVCRMILAGDTCPYGHRCHFRHALTEEERLMGPQLKPSMQA